MKSPDNDNFHGIRSSSSRTRRALPVRPSSVGGLVGASFCIWPASSIYLAPISKLIVRWPESGPEKIDCQTGDDKSMHPLSLHIREQPVETRLYDDFGAHQRSISTFALWSVVLELAGAPVALWHVSLATP